MYRATLACPLSAVWTACFWDLPHRIADSMHNTSRPSLSHLPGSPSVTRPISSCHQRGRPISQLRLSGPRPAKSGEDNHLDALEPCRQVCWRLVSRSRMALPAIVATARWPVAAGSASSLLTCAGTLWIRSYFDNWATLSELRLNASGRP